MRARRTLTIAVALAVAFAPGIQGVRARAGTAELTAQLDELVRGFGSGAGIYIADPAGVVPLYVENEDDGIITASL